SVDPSFHLTKINSNNYDLTTVTILPNFVRQRNPLYKKIVLEKFQHDLNSSLSFYIVLIQSMTTIR
ncbi:hypothetical protein L0N33_24535, partial [Roseburia faecis]|nr:hypothetical protein [Roseburia faecis]